MAKADDEVTRRFREAMLEPLPPEVQAAEDARIAAFLAGLPDAEGTFGGHLVTDACYRLDGCGPGCPPGIRVDAAKLSGTDGIRSAPRR
jgi:hypothetical protein